MTAFQQHRSVLNTPHPMNIGIRPDIWIGIKSPGDRILLGGEIDTTKDKSGNSRDGRQTTPADRPSPLVINGKETIDFDGVSEFIDFPTIYTYGTQATWFLVCKKSTGTDDYVMSGGGALSGSGTPAFLSQFTVASSLQAFEFFVSEVASGGNYREILKTSEDTNLHVLTASHDDAGGIGSAKGYYDGVEQYSLNTDDIGGFVVNILGMQLLNLGCVAPFSNFYGGPIAEFIIYGSILSDIQRNIIQQYLRNMWGTP